MLTSANYMTSSSNDHMASVKKIRKVKCKRIKFYCHCFKKPFIMFLQHGQKRPPPPFKNSEKPVWDRV